MDIHRQTRHIPTINARWSTPTNTRHPDFDDAYVSVLASGDFIRGDARDTYGKMEFVLRDLASTYPSQAPHFLQAAGLLRQASESQGAMVRNPDAHTYSARALRRVATEGEAVLPLLPGGKSGFFELPNSRHALLLHLQRSHEGITADLYNLGMGLEQAVAPRQRVTVWLAVMTRVVAQWLCDKFGLATLPNLLARKVPARLRLHLPAQLSVAQLQAALAPAFTNIGSNVSGGYTSEQIQAVYDGLRRIGQEQLDAPQRFQAPQDSQNCAHKTPMALVANTLPEDSYRIFRAALLRRASAVSHRATSALVPPRLAAKAEKAARQSIALRGRDSVLRKASEVPGLPPLLGEAANAALRPINSHKDLGILAGIVVGIRLACRLLPHFNTAFNALKALLLVQMLRLPGTNAGVERQP